MGVGGRNGEGIKQVERKLTEKYVGYYLIKLL